MWKESSFPSRCFFLCPLLTAWCLSFATCPASAQEKVLEGKTFKSYKPGYFKPRRGLQYNLFLSPVLTVDPLGIGGKSTYAIGAGTRINLWESKVGGDNLQGLRVKGLYTGFGYEYYPQQADNIYTSLWLRVRTFMPITARMEVVYSFENGLQGLSSRYGVGFEVKGITLLLAGTITNFFSMSLGDHPWLDTVYSNAGSIILVIPVYNHYPAPR